MSEEEPILVSYQKFPNNSSVKQNKNIVIPREYILIYSRQDLLTESSQRLLQQFNVDFDRQQLFIKRKPCKSRCSFFRKVTKIIRKQEHMDFLLFACQQSILGNVLQSVHQILVSNQIPYFIRDSNSATKINVDLYKKEKNGNKNDDLNVTVKKQMYLIDDQDPELIVNVFDIRIEISSIKRDNEIQVSVKFQWPLTR